MRRRTAAVLLAMGIIAVFATSSSTAASVYEMGGGGTLTAAAGQPGMPACAPGVNQPSGSCGTTTETTWVFGSLPIFSAGALFDQPQAGAYDCQASVITTKGGSDNFKLNWNFDCTSTQGAGHPRITGNFHNATPGSFAFEGCFKVGASTLQQYNCAGATGQTVTATCVGMFEPTAFTGSPPRITQVLFEGSCSSASA